jgi:hypothetical protein
MEWPTNEQRRLDCHHVQDGSGPNIPRALCRFLRVCRSSVRIVDPQCLRHKGVYGDTACRACPAAPAETSLEK